MTLAGNLSNCNLKVIHTSVQGACTPLVGKSILESQKSTSLDDVTLALVWSNWHACAQLLL